MKELVEGPEGATIVKEVNQTFQTSTTTIHQTTNIPNTKIDLTKTIKTEAKKEVITINNEAEEAIDIEALVHKMIQIHIKLQLTV